MYLVSLLEIQFSFTPVDKGGDLAELVIEASFDHKYRLGCNMYGVDYMRILKFS